MTDPPAEAPPPGVSEPPDEAPEEARNEGASRSVLLPVGLLLLAAVTVVLLVNTVRRPAFFRIEARSEIVEVAIRPSEASPLANLHWEIPGDTVLVNDERMLFAGQVVPGAGSRVVLRRSGTGPVFVEVRAPSETDVAAVLRVADDPVATALGEFVLRGDARADRTYTFPYFGAASIGDVVSSAGADLLLDGTVSILGSTFLGDRFAAAAIPLRMGDEVRVASGASRAGSDRCGATDPGAPGVGVVRADAGPGLAIVHEARGRALRISRLGAPPHCFRASLWSFLSADPVLGGLVLFAVAVLIALVQNLIGRALLDRREGSLANGEPGAGP